MKIAEMKILPRPLTIVIGLVVILITTSCRGIDPSSEKLTPAQLTSTRPSANSASQHTPNSSPTPTKSTQRPEIPTVEDEYLSVSKVQEMYSISDKIEIKLTVIGEWVSLQGPCNMWFERKAGGDWEKVGQCERTFDDEPYALLQGEEKTLKLPLTDQNQSDHAYKYILTPGTYRFAISYWVQNEPRLIYTPEFQIVEFQFTEDENIRITSVENTYTMSDKIKFNLTFIGAIVYFHGPCDTWFERKEGHIWEKVGYCPDTNFTDEPGSFGARDKFKLILPTSNLDEYHYSYALIPGTYRYAFTYWTEDGDYLLYSPEIQITGDPITKEKY